MYLLFSLALCAYFIALLPAVGYHALRHGKSVGRLRDRCGRISPDINPDRQRSIWIHAVSVGEVLAVRSLVRRLKEIYPGHRLVVSTTTVTGQHVAKQLAESVDATFYAPLDFNPFVTRTLDRVKPDLLVLVDTELWPNLLRVCRRRGVKTVLINGRLSDSSYRGYRLIRPFMRRVLATLDHVCVQTEVWGQRFVELGLPSERITVTGSLKFDSVDVSATGADLHVGDRVLPYFGFATNRPVVMAASTRNGEEKLILTAFERLRESFGDAILILAPRHPERFEEVRQLVVKKGFAVARRTELTVDEDPSVDVIVLNTIGELTRLFQIATVVFVGGSLVSAGGHNILEPAVFGKPVVFGPHMQNFAEIAALFIARDAAWQVSSASELGVAFKTLIGDPNRCAALGTRARALVDENRGAGNRSLMVIACLLPPNSTQRNIDVRELRAVPSSN